MAHTSYDSIRELDKERRRNEGPEVPVMLVEDYMIPPPFWELGGSLVKMEHIRNYVISTPCVSNSNHQKEFVKCANSSNRIRVKNICSGVLIEFEKMVNAARFVGTTGANMRCGYGYETARVYRVGEEEYAFEYDGKERPLEDGSRCSSLDGWVVAVSGKGERVPFPSYLSIAKHLGLLIGHIYEERKRKLAKKYVLGKETFTLEFGGKKRVIDGGRGIHCRWKGIYDEDFEEIGGVGGMKVTYGNPIKRDDVY